MRADRRDDEPEVVYRPGDLDFDAFTEIDGKCFPDEPIDHEVFEEVVTAEFWGVRRAGRWVAYSFLRSREAFAWISRVGVRASERNRGVGNLLMESMLERSRELGHRSALLYVEQGNPSAIHLYEKHGFQVREETRQYVVPVHPHAPSSPCSIRAVPVTDLPPERRPAFTPQWEHLLALHDPPETHVLVFFIPGGEKPLGYCRLAPGFPGCFPLLLDDPDKHLAAVIDSIRPRLLPEHDILKLTFTGAALAAACEAIGCRLNYRLFKMETVLPGRTRIR